ncbi:hypothetical protein [Streptomyces sp. NPDC096132]|uniref:right-handed parallel beta-helix repeat-containing protein n=1 Tax=Streptomyces sp. NPDC096132 TaxID=3366075 RepID=UPI0038192CFC
MVAQPAGSPATPDTRFSVPSLSYVSAEIGHSALTGNAYGLFLSGANGVSISDSTVQGSLEHGVVLHRFVTNAVVERTVSKDNGDDGFVLARATERSGSAVAPPRATCLPLGPRQPSAAGGFHRPRRSERRDGGRRVGTVVQDLTVEQIGDEAFLLRNFSSGNMVRDNTASNTGRRRESTARASTSSPPSPTVATRLRLPSHVRTKISYIHAMAEVCEETGADVTGLAQA